MEQQRKRRTNLSGKWLWIAMLVSPLGWAIPYSVQHIPDPAAWRAFNAHLNDQLKLRCGPDAGQACAAFGRSWQKQATSATQLLNAIPTELVEGYAGVLPAGSQLSAPLYRGAEAGTSETLVQLPAMTAAGCAHPVQTIGVAGEIEAGFLGIHRASRLYANLACMPAARGDWDGALRHIEASARSGDALRMYGMDGVELATAIRARAYKACTQLLDLHPDAAASRRIIALLDNLAATEPRPDLHTLCGHYLQQIHWRTEDPGLPVTLQTDALNNMRLDGPFSQARSVMFQPFPMEIGRTGPIPWTQIGATFAGIRRIVEEESMLLAARANAMEPLKNTDTLYRALCVYACPANRVLRAVSESRALVTNRELLQLACAARARREEHSAWPQSLDELKTYMPASAARPGASIMTEMHNASLGNMLTNAEVPYGPFRAGMTSVTRENLGAFLGFEIPQGACVEWNGPYAGRCRVLVDLPLPGNPPSLGLVIAHCLADICKQRVGDAVTSLTVYAQRTAEMPKAPSNGEIVLGSTMMPGFESGMMYGGLGGMEMRPPVTLSRPTSPEQAIQLALRDSDVLSSLAKLGGADQAIPPDANAVVQNVLLQLELSIPETAFAVWSAGPDSKDNGGAFEFAGEHPAFRVSPGDMIIFP